MIIDIIKGLLLGLGVGAFNNLLAVFALGKVKADDKKAKKKIGGVFFLRYALIFLTLFLVRTNPPMLIGAGLALAGMTHIMVIKNMKRKG